MIKPRIAELLKKTEKKLSQAGITSAPLEAEVLLLHALSLRGGRRRRPTRQSPAPAKRLLRPHFVRPRSDKLDRSWLLANLDFEINQKTFEKFNSFLKRRLEGEPVAYILGRKEFYGLEFKVNKNVLIPRPETELLVELTLKRSKKLEARSKRAKILDLGIGSGCIIISIAKNLQPTSYKLSPHFFASDISQKALATAKKNAGKHRVLSKIDFRQGDLFEPWGKMKFDLIIANLPYLKKSELLPYEPTTALFGGREGIELYQRFFARAPKYLQNNGIILIEMNPGQKNILIKTVKEYFPKSKIRSLKDLSGKNRFLEIHNA